MMLTSKCLTSSRGVISHFAAASNLRIRASSGVRRQRGHTLPNVTSLGQGAYDTESTGRASASQSIPEIPLNLQQQVSQANASWLRRCLEDPLVEPETGAVIFVLGIQHFAPLQADESTTALELIFSRVKPALLALDLPPQGASSSGGGFGAALLPFPLPLQLLLEYAEQLRDPQTGEVRLWSGEIDAEQDVGAFELLEALRSSGTPARTGKDLIDPFEALGFYPGADLVTRPEQAVLVAELCGFLPGAAYATAVQLADEDGAQVHCVDAPLKLQEAWVQDMVKTFSLGESDLMRQPQVALEAQMALLSDEFVEWDRRLADLISDTPLAIQTAAFKVSRALAAATLDAETVGPAGSRQAALQPLKFRHFERCALHMARQLRELCLRHDGGANARVRRQIEAFGRAPSAASTSTAAVGSQQWLSEMTGRTAAGGMARGGDRFGSSAGASSSSATGGFEDFMSPGESGATPAAAPCVTVLALVGRQYEPMLRRLWRDPTSAVFTGQVPRTFAPSSVAQPATGPVEDPDVLHGGSRPVGQVPIDLTADGPQQRR